MSKNISALSGRKGLIDNLFEKMGTLTEKDGAFILTYFQSKIDLWTKKRKR